MLRRIMAIVSRDIKSGLRDAMILYILIVPMLIAAILNAFIPSAGANLIHVVTLSSSDQAFINMLEDHGQVELAEDRDEIIKRVSATDDVFGVIATPDGIE